MKKILIYPLLLLVIVFACKKTIQPTRPPSVLFISGIVTDKLTTIQIDSVSITLYYKNGIMSIAIPQTTVYSEKNGKFNFQFSPKENYIYQIGFDKTGSGYKWLSKSIDRYKEYQEFNVSLEK